MPALLHNLIFFSCN